jgi:hypothetical protein
MSKMAMPVKVPVVEMEGVGAGAKDFHYGNNVKLIPGHAYKVTVSIGGESASFMFKA